MSRTSSRLIPGIFRAVLECGSLLPLYPRELARVPPRWVESISRSAASKLACGKAAASRRTPKQRTVARAVRELWSPSLPAASLTRLIFMNSGTGATMTRAMESHYPRTPTGHSIKGYGRLRTTTELSLPLGILQKQVRTRKIYSQAVTADDFISRKLKPFGQIRSTWLGTASRDSNQRELSPPTPLACKYSWVAMCLA